MSDRPIIVGAGIAGLTLANLMKAPKPLFLEKSRGVGGRCATRRVQGDLPVDHGVPMIHGRSPELREFLSALDPEEIQWDWPMRVRGDGTPCQPQAYDSRTWRAAFARGVTTFAKHLAEPFEVRRETEVQRISLGDRCFELAAGAETFRTRALVLTCPLPQTVALVEPLAQSAPELSALLQVLQRVHTLPSLTVLAGYDRPTADDWHLRVPGPDSVIHTIVNDSSKRPDAPSQVLVIQGNPVFSRQNLEADPARWGDELLGAAASVLGPWAAEPTWHQEHRWRHARVQRGDELSNPVLLSWPDGQTLALCGEAFNGAGGVEGALLSACALARRLEHGQPSPVSGA